MSVTDDHWGHAEKTLFLGKEQIQPLIFAGRLLPTIMTTIIKSRPQF